MATTRRKRTTKKESPSAAPKEATVDSAVVTVISVKAKKTMSDGDGNFYTNEVFISSPSGDVETSIDEMQEVANRKVDEAIEAYSGFEGAEVEEEELEEEEEELEEEEFEEDEEEEDEEELSEDDIMKMKKAELLEIIDEEELDIDTAGMKIKDIREEVIDAMFGEEEEEYEEEFDEE